jgi:superfamily II DNA/RNA helicase/biotin carboxyl carrier protein
MTPFPIQEMTLPVALSGKDVIGQAKTGTGKTLGFGLPLLERVTVPADVEAGRAEPEDLTEAPQALVVVPTRELCTQVTNDLQTAGKVRNVRVLAIYGGRAYEPQVDALKKGVDVVVGTPGRLLDLAGQKKLNLKHVKSLVLDEADEMLDLGFLPDVEKIINMLPVRRQTMLFSATMPGAVIGLARRYMSQPTHISATSPDDAGATVANTKQFVYRAHNMDKPEMVARILQADGRGLAMVFCRTKRTAADLADQLKQRGFASGAVHGDLGQGAREQALRAFRNGKVDVLVCTDVAARGIDVEGVTHVINYQSPEEEKTYLHRIGRTGRAGAKGTAITLVDWDDIPRWQLINKALDLGFSDPPETYSTSPHFYTDLGIPEGTKGVLPRSERTRAGLDAEELEDLGETGGRGPRGRGGRGGRGDRDESRSADPERSSRTPRRRRRTRGGATVDGAPESAGTTAPDSTVTGGAAETDAVTAPRTPRRRRRTRGGAQSEAAPVTAVESPVSEQAEAAVATAEGTAAEAPEAAAKPRRRRTRRSETPVVETEAAVTPSAPEQPTVVEAAPEAALPEAAAKPRRRTRKATAASAAESAVDTAEGATEAAAEPEETVDRQEWEIRRIIGAFLAERRRDDLLVLYVSCHGALDPYGRLHFAATDTVKERLASTAVEAAWLVRQLEECRAIQKVLILDCCFSGLVGRTKGSDTDVEWSQLGSGRGFTILTASRGTEYSYEGEPIPSSGVSRSDFTAALVDGLRSGAADARRVGYVSVDDAFEYTTRLLRSRGRQNPQKWAYEREGEIVLCRSPHSQTAGSTKIPDELRDGFHSRDLETQLTTLREAATWLASCDPDELHAARNALNELLDEIGPLYVEPSTRSAGERPPPRGDRGTASQPDDSPVTVQIAVRMPNLGESVTEGTVTRWLKRVGDPIEVEEPLVEVSTDKVDTEIASPASGILTRILIQEDHTGEIGATLALIDAVRSG